MTKDPVVTKYPMQFEQVSGFDNAGMVRSFGMPRVNGVPLMSASREPVSNVAGSQDVKGFVVGQSGLKFKRYQLLTDMNVYKGAANGKGAIKYTLKANTEMNGLYIAPDKDTFSKYPNGFMLLFPVINGKKHALNHVPVSFVRELTIADNLGFDGNLSVLKTYKVLALPPIWTAGSSNVYVGATVHGIPYMRYGQSMVKVKEWHWLNVAQSSLQATGSESSFDAYSATVPIDRDLSIYASSFSSDGLSFHDMTGRERKSNTTGDEDEVDEVSLDEDEAADEPNTQQKVSGWLDTISKAFGVIKDAKDTIGTKSPTSTTGSPRQKVVTPKGLTPLQIGLIAGGIAALGFGAYLIWGGKEKK